MRVMVLDAASLDPLITLTQVGAVTGPPSVDLVAVTSSAMCRLVPTVTLY